MSKNIVAFYNSQIIFTYFCCLLTLNWTNFTFYWRWKKNIAKTSWFRKELNTFSAEQLGVTNNLGIAPIFFFIFLRSITKERWNSKRSLQPHFIVLLWSSSLVQVFRNILTQCSLDLSKIILKLLLLLNWKILKARLNIISFNRTCSYLQQSV